MKSCRGCGETKELSDFGRDRQYADGYRTRCKDCRRLTKNESERRRYERKRDHIIAVVKAYDAANRDKVRAYRLAWREADRQRESERARAWAQANSARVRANNRCRHARKRRATVVPFTRAQLDARMAVFGYRCWMCGGPFEHVDHVKPLARGGPHMLANLRPACAACNLRKHAAWAGASDALALALLRAG